jgi:hypothetical protein
MDPKKHMDQFLSICDIHLIEHDDVMVKVFLQTLIGPTYDWYLSLLAQSIAYFDDIEDMFMTDMHNLLHIIHYSPNSLKSIFKRVKESRILICDFLRH